MVNSADESPQSNSLYSWAKSKAAKFHLSSSVNKDPPPSSSAPSSFSPGHPGDSQPQDAGHDALQPSAPRTSSDHDIHSQDINQQSTSTVDTEGDGEKSSPIDHSAMPALSLQARFVRDLNRILRSSWINWLLLVVPVAMILGGIQDWGGIQIVSPAVIFALNAVAIIPLASLLAYATENVASRLGDTIGALLNVTFGNAVEIIIFIIALAAGEVRIVQAAALGSILANLLLILGMGFVLGGLRFREQLYNTSASQMSACLLSLSVISLLLPTAFHAAFDDTATADAVVLPVSRGTAVILLLVYVLYLLFQLKSHSFIFESTPQKLIDEEAHPGVMAAIFDSSSSSEDSSSSDSDSSYNTARRIKRALRRKSRKPSTVKENNSIFSTRRSTMVSAHFESDPTVNEAHLSGDEADNEARLRHHLSGANTIAQDFETQPTGEKTKRSKKSKRSSRRKQKGELSEKAEAEAATRPVPTVEVTVADPAPESTTTRPPFHLRTISDAIKPVLSSEVFPHHQASARSLVAPAFLRSVSRSPDRHRRTSSMPAIGRRQSPAVRGRSPGLVVPLDAIVDAQTEQGHNPEPHLSRTSSVILLLCSTALVAMCAEFLVSSIDYMVHSSGLSQAFIGLIILPIVGNAAEHVTAVTVAYKNKMDLAINIALGSSIQIALFVTPLMVMLGWAMGQQMSLYFSLFETVSLFASAFIVNYLMIDGRTNYLEGVLLVAVYVIISIAAFFYPDNQHSAM